MTCIFQGAALAAPALELAQSDRAAAGATPALLAEINAARTDPRAYAQALRGELSYFRGLVLEVPGREAVETAEGAPAVNEAIADLESRPPAPPLTADSAINQAALRLVTDQGRSGALGHVDSHNATLRDRLEGAGVSAVSMEEDITYGPTDPQEVVRELIVDDGVPDRAHRKAIFDTTMTRAGFACGPHATWGWMCVIDFTGGAAPSHRSKTGAALGVTPARRPQDAKARLLRTALTP